jgi:hypothetical protein
MIDLCHETLSSVINMVRVWLSMAIKCERMIILYLVPISTYLGKENRYFYTWHSNNLMTADGNISIIKVLPVK